MFSLVCLAFRWPAAYNPEIVAHFMAKAEYLTAPLKTDKMPPGVPFIVGNEAAERFSYYGMNSILVVFMTRYLLDAHGHPDHMTEPQADAWYHTFVSCLYFLPLVGALLGDAVLGKYRTILFLSIVYCFGHLALALDHTRLGLTLGLGLIALGAGGIKPCVSANVGDQFGASNQHLLTRVFSWFYFSINFGSSFSTLLIPWLLDPYSPSPSQAEHWPAWLVRILEKLHGPQIAFGTPGILMFVATVIFWLGRKSHPGALYRHVLGTVATKLLLLDTSSSKDGSPRIRHRMESSSDSNREPHLHPLDAASVFLCHLSGYRARSPADAVA